MAGGISCKREERSFRVAPPAAALPENVTYENRVRPGPIGPAMPLSTQPVSVAQLTREPSARQYPNNAQAQSDGQALYEAFNCVGCHAHGGGGIGPPLMDPYWYYGGDPEPIYQSILEGRPNGMPSFRGRIPDNQIWAIVAYVRSLSGQASPNAAQGREDHMRAQPPPNSISGPPPQQVPSPTTVPATATATETGRASETNPANATEATSE